MIFNWKELSTLVVPNERKYFSSSIPSVSGMLRLFGERCVIVVEWTLTYEFAWLHVYGRQSSLRIRHIRWLCETTVEIQDISNGKNFNFAIFFSNEQQEDMDRNTKWYLTANTKSQTQNIFNVEIYFYCLRSPLSPSMECCYFVWEYFDCKFECFYHYYYCCCIALSTQGCHCI